MELGQQHSPTRNLGMDMLRERGLHHDYVTALLQHGYFLEALRYARKYKVLNVPMPWFFLSYCLVPWNIFILVKYFV
jgi:regulator of MON1-CCZ1 complex